MAMINCPYCNEKITSTSSSCIFCGKALKQNDVSVGLSKANEEFQKKVQQNSSVAAKKPSGGLKSEKKVTNLFHSWMASDPVYIKKNTRSKRLDGFISTLVMIGLVIAIMLSLMGASGDDPTGTYKLARIGLIICAVVSIGWFAYFCRFTLVPLYNVRTMIKDVRAKRLNVNPSIKLLIGPFRNDTEEKAVADSFVPSFLTAMCLLKKKSIVTLIVQMVVSNVLLLCVAAFFITFGYGICLLPVEGWNSLCTLSMILFGVAIFGKIIEIFVFKEIYRAKFDKFLKKEYPVEYNTVF